MEEAIHASEFTLLVSALIALITPFISFIVSAFFVPNRYAWVSPIISMGLLSVCLIASVLLYMQSDQSTSIELATSWIQISDHSVSVGVLLDVTSIRMTLVVAIVSLLVHIFSAGYMANDASLARYYAFLGLFTFGMLLLTIANDLLIFFVGWETVGVCSYILIGHWTEKPAAGRAAFQAFIINRTGDLGFFAGLMMLWNSTGTLNITDLSVIHLPGSVATAISLSLFWAVMAKSAQFPLSSWLPSAMEGPTPVSALIHAATMVVAGVYLLVRVNWIFTGESMDIFIVVGTLTSLIGGLCALSQFDIKKILAYSTVSQLGFMVMAVGSSNSNASMLHITTHAFFKAALFLAAGAVIHAMHTRQLKRGGTLDVQDIRNMGGFGKLLPTTFVVAMIAAASLIGFPLTSGFLSKDAIHASLLTWAADSRWRQFIAGVSFVTSIITIFYVARLLRFVFFGKSTDNESLSGSPWVMRMPMIILAALSLWFMVSLNPFGYGNWKLETAPVLAIFSAVWVAGGSLGAFLYYRRQQSPSVFSILFHQGLYMENMNAFAGNIVIRLSNLTLRFDRNYIDKFLHALVYAQVALSFMISWIDRIFVDGITTMVAKMSGSVGKITKSFQGGNIQLYIFWSVFGLIIFLLIMFK